MSEFLEKVEQPELVLGPSHSVILNHSQIGLKERDSEVDPQRTVKLKQIDLSNKIANFDAEDAFNEPKIAYPKTSEGIVRHRVITGCCLALSLAILGLSVLDLRGLIEKPGTLSASFVFTPEQKKNHLPTNLRYEGTEASEGLREVGSATWSDTVYGFADEEGNLVIPRKFSEVSSFHDGLAAVKFRGEKDPKTDTYPSKDGLPWAIIDKTGKVVLPAKYSEIGEFKNGVAPVAFDGSGALINKKGEIIARNYASRAPIQFGDLYEMSQNNSKVGLVDHTGKYVVPPIYDRMSKFDEPEYPVHFYNNPRPTIESSNAYVKVWQNGKCGVIDQDGTLMLPINFNEIASFNKGHAVVLVHGKYGLVDSDGKFIIDPNYTFMTMFDDIIAAKEKSGMWKVFNGTGKLLNTKIDGAIANSTTPWLSDGRAPFILGDKCGFLNSAGEVAIKPEYDFVKPFSEGYGLIKQDGMWTFIDKAGTIVTKQSFSQTSLFSQGSAKVSAAGALYDFISASAIESRRSESAAERNRLK